MSEPFTTQDLYVAAACLIADHPVAATQQKSDVRQPRRVV
jgi:hypothetical protein